MSPHVKGERRGLVQAVRDAADRVLDASNYAEAYIAFAELGHAVNDLDTQVAATAPARASVRDTAGNP